MSIALHGNLRDFGMGEVFQLIGQQRKTGVLQVRGAEGEVELRFDGGCVVAAAPIGSYEEEPLGEMAVRCGVLPREKLADAERRRADGGGSLRPQLLAVGLAPEVLLEIEDLLTRETLFGLLRWEDGSFRFVAQPIPHDRPADSLIAAEQVLMDGLRMVDEWSVFAQEVPAESTVYRRRGDIEEYRGSPAGRSAPDPADAEKLFLLLDGRSTVRRVIDLSRLGTFTGMRILVHLARAGWIEAVRTASASGLAGEAAGALAAARYWAARGVPLAVLGLLAVIAVAGGTAHRPGAPIARDALAAGRAGYAAVQLRALSLAERLARGRAPQSLAELRRWPDGDDSVLAHGRTGAYYLARRGAGGEASLVILAPER
jgi:hypothetical protein